MDSPRCLALRASLSCRRLYLHHEQARADAAQRSLSYLPLVAEIIAAGQQAGTIRDGAGADELALYLTEAALVSITRNCLRLTDAEFDALIASRSEILRHGVRAP